MLNTALSVALSLALLCACSHRRTVNTGDASISSDKDGNSVHIVARDGIAVDINERGKAITDYPSDVPIYEGKSMMDAKAEKDHLRTVMLQTSDSLGKVTDFYKGRLEDKGWKIESSVNTPQATIYRATKDDRKLSITIADGDGGKASVTQVLSDK
jgi:hypothetical protein